MTNVIRSLFCLNTAIWLGAGLFLTLVVGPILFSHELAQSITRRQAGMIAQVILARYFTAQLVTATVALAGGAFARTLGWRWPQLALPVTGLLLILVVVAGLVVQPKMHDWTERRYAAMPGSIEEQTAQKKFGQLHGLAQLGNLIVLMGVAFHGIQQFAVHVTPRSKPDTAHSKMGSATER